MVLRAALVILHRRLIETFEFEPAAVLLRVARARVIDQHIAHHARRQPKEMLPTLLIQTGGLAHPCIGFVHDGGRLQCVSRPLVTQVVAGNSLQLFIHRWSYFGQRGFVAMRVALGKVASATGSVANTCGTVMRKQTNSNRR